MKNIIFAKRNCKEKEEEPKPYKCGDRLVYERDYFDMFLKITPYLLMLGVIVTAIAFLMIFSELMGQCM